MPKKRNLLVITLLAYILYVPCIRVLFFPINPALSLCVCGRVLYIACPKIKAWDQVGSGGGCGDDDDDDDYDVDHIEDSTTNKLMCVGELSEKCTKPEGCVGRMRYRGCRGYYRQWRNPKIANTTSRQERGGWLPGWLTVSGDYTAPTLATVLAAGCH